MAAEICTATESGIAAEVRARDRKTEIHMRMKNRIERARDATPKRGNCEESMPNLYRVTPEVLLMGLLLNMLPSYLLNIKTVELELISRLQATCM